MKNIQKIFVTLMLFSLSNFSLTAFAENELKIISLQHRFASDLLPTISPMVGENGTATGTNNHLFVRTSPERLRDIEAIIAQLDIERVNRKITVAIDSVLQNERDNVEVTGTISKDTINIDTIKTNSIKTSKIIINNNRDQPYNKPNTGRIGIARNITNNKQNSLQFINVIDGERAFIKMGQIVPYSQEWITITRRYIQIDRTTDWREISTGFAVRSRTIGDNVTLEITPRIAKLNSFGYIDFESLSTVINLKLGDWVNIGSIMQNKDEVSRKILGLQTSDSTMSSSIRIKVE